MVHSDRPPCLRFGMAAIWLFALASALSIPLAVVSQAESPAPPAKKAPEPDVLVFTNGDRISGKLVQVLEGTVTFHSDMLGDVSVPWSKVKSLHSSQPFAVIQKGQLLSRKSPPKTLPQGTIAVDNGELSVVEPPGPNKIPVAQTQDLVPQGEYQKKMYGHQGFLHGWAGNATVGAALVEATQNSRSFNEAATLARAVPGVKWLAPAYRTSFDFSSSYGEVTSPQTTPTKTNILTSDLEQDWYLSPRAFFLADASFQHNYSQGLSLQEIYGAGIGYTAIKDAKQQLDLKADIHFERQTFNPTPGVTPVVVNPSKNLIGMDLGDTYMRKLPRSMTLNQTLILTPAFNDVNAYSVLATAGVLFPVYKRFSFNVASQDNFLNDPAFGSKKNTFQFTAGLTYTID